jgi:O-succinylbenzoic acid--CoA ligase
MNQKPSYRNVHNRFKLNGNNYSFNDLFEVAYSFIKEGKPHEKVIGDFLMDWMDPKEELILKTSGSTGTPKQMRYAKQAMVNSALATGDHFGVQIGDRALHCLSADFIAGKMMLVRAMILGLELDIVSPNGNVLDENPSVYDFAAMVPIQVVNAMSQINQVKKLLIGGAAPSTTLLQQLQSKETNSFVTYGMTLTHIASRSVKSKDTVFNVLPGVQITQDARQCLNIEVPYLTKDTVVTNDLVTIISDTSFTLLGRIDHVINSGGVKVIPEAVEEKISSLIACPFFITSVADEQLGQKVVLVLEQKEDAQNIIELIKEKKILSTYELPKKVFFLDAFEYTENGKLKRKATAAKLEARPY